jgi:hypothetical protein
MEHAINKYEINIHNAQLIKIDVEGWEYNVILSLQEHLDTIKRCRIIIEISKNYELIHNILIDKWFQETYKWQARNFVYEKK